MKTLLLIGLVAGALFCTTGCFGDPGYSSEERNQRINRNINYEGGMAVEDFDRLLLLRPASDLTTWDVQ
jgi:hypothetical protein